MQQSEMKAGVLDLLDAIDARGAELRQPLTENASNATLLVSALLVGCVRLGRGVRLLLSQDYPEEALFLVRTLLHDSTTLAYLHAHRSQLDALTYGFLRDSLSEERGLEMEAASVRLKRPPGRMDRIRDDLAKVKALAEAAGIKRPPRLPSLKTMLRELNSAKLYWFYKKASTYIHSASPGLASRLEWIDEDHVAVRMEGTTEGILQAGWLTTENLLTAHIAAFDLLGWNELEEWAALREEVRIRYREILVAHGMPDALSV
jgi:hypothetical protein